MKKQNKDRLELCRLIDEGVVDMDMALLELISRTTPSKIKELIKDLTDKETSDK